MMDSSITYPPRSAAMPMTSAMDDDLARLVRRTSVIRQGFYVVVLLVALAGQVSGAVETLGIPLIAAIPALGALELGGIVVLANADVRRRLGERAIASRLLSVAIAGSAVTFNWLAHSDHLLGGFFAGMSALGYLVWVMHTENQRRDRLRAQHALPPTTPAYELLGHWLRHPLLTGRAQTLAKEDPQLGLYESLAFARDDIKRERRQSAIAKVLHRKIRAAVDPKTADIALAVYDLDEIAIRLTSHADYDGLTALIAGDLDPVRLAGRVGHPAAGKNTGQDETDELGWLLDGRLGGDAPVSPAPAGADSKIVPDSVPDSVRDSVRVPSADPAEIVPGSSWAEPAQTAHSHASHASHETGLAARFGRPREDVSELLPHAVRAAEELTRDGRSPSRDAVAEHMRRSGVPVSNAAASQLVGLMRGQGGRVDRRNARRNPSVKKARSRG